MNTLIGLAFCLLLGFMVRAQGVGALLWVPLGFILGVFVSAQILLPVLLGLPLAIQLVRKGEMRATVFGSMILKPVISVAVLLLLSFSIGFFWPAVAHRLYANAPFNLASWLGLFGIILSPLSAKHRSDFRRDFDCSYGRFYTDHAQALAGLRALSAASGAFDAALLASEGYTTRANHRFANDAARHDGRVAPYTDPVEMAPYSKAELDAHTAAIERATSAFDDLSAAFASLGPTNGLHAEAAALYKAESDRYAFVVAAYCNAVSCAMITALGGGVQAIKDSFRVTLLETRAAHSPAEDRSAAQARAAAFKAKTGEDAVKAKALEEAATIAEAKAKTFRAKAEAAQAKAGEALKGKPGNHV
jgi:hypothetical protein